jgi:DNA-binding CsgD family transcriptional regulator
MAEALALLDTHVGGSVFSVSSMILADLVNAQIAIRGGTPISEREYADWQRLLGTHPYFPHVIGGPPAASRLTDVVDLGRFEHTELYQTLLHPRGSRYQAALPLYCSPGELLLLSVWRDDRDFSDPELDMLERFRTAMAAGLAFRRAVVALEVMAAGVQFDRGTDGLTRRQRQVAALVELGLTNRQIGARLGLTERTVRKHVADLFVALGCDSRTLIAVRWRARRASPSLDLG